MDSNNWRSERLPADGDWRSQLQNYSRERIVLKMMDAVKCHRLLSGQEGNEECMKIARRFEEKIFHESTSQSDYLRRVSLKMFTMESESNPLGTMQSAIPSNSAGISRNPQDPASSDSTSQTTISELQDVYLKIQVMKDLYYLEIHGIHQKVCSKIQQHDSLSQQAKSDGIERLKYFKQMLERILQCLQMSRSAAQHFQKDKLAGLEKQILGVINSHRPRKPAPPMQQGQISQSHMQPHSQITQAQSHENGVNSQLQSVHGQGDMSGMNGAVSSLTGITSSQPNMMNSLQPASSLESGQGNAPNSIQQNPLNPPQQATPQTGVNLMHPSTNMLQSQHIKQQHEQQLKQQLQHRQQLIHKQQLFQQQQQQQMMQSQTGQLQQHLGLPQQPNSLQQNMQQRLQSSNALLQQQNVIDPQKMFHSQRTPAEAPSTSLDSTAQTSISESQEEVYQKMKVMKDLYFQEIHDIYQKICLKIQQHDSLSQQAKSDGIERLKYFKQMLERILQCLQMSRSAAQHFQKDKLASLEKQILGVINGKYEAARSFFRGAPV